MKVLNFLLKPVKNRIFDSCHRTQKLQPQSKAAGKWNFARVVFFLYCPVSELSENIFLFSKFCFFEIRYLLISPSTKASIKKVSKSVY
jgi:hypothetical protein